MLLIFLSVVLCSLVSLVMLAYIGFALMRPSKALLCPYCGSAVCERKGRMAKDFVPRLFGFYPWWCRSCRARFRLRRRSLPAHLYSQQRPPVPVRFAPEPDHDVEDDYVHR